MTYTFDHNYDINTEQKCNKQVKQVKNNNNSNIIITYNLK